eukprot:scaffold30596_cov96-Isochrysis_galbana.AAC.1
MHGRPTPPSNRCSYSVEYAEGSSISGTLVEDEVRPRNGTRCPRIEPVYFGISQNRARVSRNRTRVSRNNE